MEATKNNARIRQFLTQPCIGGTARRIATEDDIEWIEDLAPAIFEDLLEIEGEFTLLVFDATERQTGRPRQNFGLRWLRGLSFTAVRLDTAMGWEMGFEV